MPRESELPGILIELKAEKDCPDGQLKELSKAALKQILDRRYDADMLAKGVQTIFKYGVAFSGKKVEISTELC